MARVSGLASEHHPVGPGDAPRRKKGRKSTPSVDFSMGSKRPASPTNEQASPAKRKRVQSDDHDQLAREFEDSVSRSQSHMSDAHNSPSISRHLRRNSEPVVAFADDEEDEDDMLMTPSASTQPSPA
ncbi:hypothetical protein N0V90_008454 [Kalmusia sp. IMI 367209]|nr:hypothetical protein N0V90_008454 [Kalmusia sp. IMI 367209]